jgi:hypothetical protein
LTIGISAALMLIVGILLYGWLAEIVLPARQPVAQVALANGQSLTILRADFHRRVRFERARYIPLAKQDAEAAGQLMDTYGFGQMILDQMLVEAQVGAEAARRGLTVSDEEIDRYIEQTYQHLLATPLAPATRGVTTPANPHTVQSRYEQDLQTWERYGVDQAEFRQLVRLQLLQNKLSQNLGPEAFSTWLETQRDLQTWLDGWDRNIPTDPAWP